MSAIQHIFSAHISDLKLIFQLLQDNKESKRWSAAQKKKRELEFGKFQPFVFAVCNCFSSVVSRRKLRRDFLLLLLLLQPSSRLVKMFLLCDCAAVFSERARHIDKCQRGKKCKHSSNWSLSHVDLSASKISGKEKRSPNASVEKPTTFFSILRS